MVYDVKSWWLMPYTIPVYISEVSQLNFPWVFLIIMHSNVFPKVPPRQNPFSKAPSPLLWLASFQAFEDTIESAKSAAQTMKRRNSLSLSVLVCICNTNWEWYPTRTCCAKTKVRRKKRKGREKGRRSWWVHKRRMGPMDGGPIWWIFFLDLLVVIFTTADPQENYGDWWAADAIAIWSLVNFTGWINTRNLLGECA